VELPRSGLYFLAGSGLVMATVASVALVRKVPIGWLERQISPAPTAPSGAKSTDAHVAAPPSVTTPAGKPLANADAALVKPSGQRPAFDIVRVEATGDAVIAGHALPDSLIELRDAGAVLAKVTADPSGQFAILPSPLSVGSHHLQLAAKANNFADVLSDDVDVEVPATAPKTASAPASLAPLMSRTSPFGLTEAAKQSEAPSVSKDVKDVRTAKVVRGDTLWRISQHYLGDGMRYLQIYTANAAQMRSPHFIYPGQILVVPPVPAPKQ
jgi:nucleoid-associated protein YgaU